jgi:hypothetical protein
VKEDDAKAAAAAAAEAKATTHAAQIQHIEGLEDKLRREDAENQQFTARPDLRTLGSRVMGDVFN